MVYFLVSAPRRKLVIDPSVDLEEPDHASGRKGVPIVLNIGRSVFVGGKHLCAEGGWLGAPAAVVIGQGNQADEEHALA
jgi:hypothetical protein